MLLSLIVALIRFPKRDAASKTLVPLLAATLLSECTAWFFTKNYGNNMPVYHIYAPVQLFIVTMYFNKSIDTFRRNNFGLYIGLLSIILAVLNTLFLQPINTLNSYYLIYSGFVIISLCNYSFYRILENDDADVLNNQHFWFSCVLLFFWSITFINWTVYKLLARRMIELIPFIGIALVIISTITYACMGIIYLIFPKAHKIER